MPPQSRSGITGRLRVLVGTLAVPVVWCWNLLVTAREGELRRGEHDPEDPLVVEHERSWVAYLRGFDAHHGEGDSEFLRDGLRLWVGSRFLRGYTLGNHVYLCPAAPLAVRVHQAGHTPAFGEVFDPIAGERREDGGLPDEPLQTLDVMLPGEFPHTFLRLTDRRGLRGAYRAWYHDGRIERLRE